MFFETPASTIRSILTYAEANYNILFDNDQLRLQCAKVDAGEEDTHRLMPAARVRVHH